MHSSYCSQCGGLLEADCDFCTNCGEPKPAPRLSPPTHARNDNAPYAPETGRQPDMYSSRLPVQYAPPAAQWQPPAPVQYAPQPLVAPYAYPHQPPGRRQVSVGLCVLVSFLWTGAGFFFIPDRVGMGLALVLCTLVIVVCGILFTSVTFGFGGLCVFPVGLAWWFGVLLCTYRSAERYNRGA